MTDRARLERLAHRGAARWSSHSSHEDLVQECRIVAWRHADEPDHLILVRCRSRCIDCLRSWHGDRRHRVPTLVPLTADPGVAADELAVATSWGLAGRLAVVATALASGERPCDIADDLGVHPSRVSQHKAQLRQLIRP